MHNSGERPRETDRSADALQVSTLSVTCPTNQIPGRRVDSLTLKALLAVPLTQVRPTDYHFCRDPDCPTVYYSADGLQCFDEAVLRERVFQKHPTYDNVFVCYCFYHTVSSIRAELVETGSTTVIESITKGIRDGQCACDIRNPQGSCCLGNVRVVVERLETEINGQGGLSLSVGHA